MICGIANAEGGKFYIGKDDRNHVIDILGEKSYCRIYHIKSPTICDLTERIEKK